MRLAAACHKVPPTLQSQRASYVQPHVTQLGAVAGDSNQGTYSITNHTNDTVAVLYVIKVNRVWGNKYLKLNSNNKAEV